MSCCCISSPVTNLQVVNREGGLLPVSKVGLEAIRKMDEAEALLQQRLGRAPTLAEIAAQVRNTSARSLCQRCLGEGT